MVDPKQLLGADDETFARELQQAASTGGFNPFSLITGERRLHSVFLAPPAPSLERDIARFLADGTGPLQGVVEQIKQQSGLDAAAAAQRARTLFAAAEGMLVVVLRDDQGLTTIPQLFFGRLDDDARDAAVASCGEDFLDADSVHAALISLREAAERGARWPDLCVGDAVAGSSRAYWEALGADLLAGFDEGLFATAPDRLSDLGHWIARALHETPGALDGEQLLIAARCHLLAGAVAPALDAVRGLLRDYQPEDEQVAVLLEQLVDVAIAHGEPERAVAFFAEAHDDLEAVLGGCYEQALPRFKATAAAMAGTEALLAAAEALRRADRKAFRHDLNREPLWRVAVADPGEVIDTHAAAEVLDRSVNFVGKRLDAGTIPWHRSEAGEVRIPTRALADWRAVMERFELLD